MTTFRSVSAHTRDVKISALPLLPLGSLPSWGEAINRLASLQVREMYDDWGNELDDEERLFEDDVFGAAPLAAQEDAEVLTRKILDAPFEMVPTLDFPDDTNKAMNAHIITGLSANIDYLPADYNVLVLCAGNGEDLVRLNYRGMLIGHDIDLVGATPYTNRAKLFVDQLGSRVRASGSYLQDLSPGWLRPTYDLIICHHGVHHIMSTQEGVLAFRSLINRLSPKGLFLGDKVDMMGLDTLSGFSHLPSHGIELMGYSRDEGFEGKFTVRVGDKVWTDEVLTDKRLYNSVPEGFTVHLLQGRGAFGSTTLHGRPFLPPKTIAEAAKRSETRVISYIEIARGQLPPSPSAPPVTNIKWVPAQTPFSKSVSDMLDFPVNKGKHFQPFDIPYLGSGANLYAEKTDGHPASVVVGEGCAYMVVHDADKRCFVAQGKTRVGQPILRLQCEYLPSGEVILLDPVHLGIDTPSGFLPRLKHYDSMCLMSPWINSLITRKEWKTSFSLEEAATWEGVVVMGVSTPSPFFGARYLSTARYSKWRPTVDTLVDGKVFEVEVDTGTVIRPRPDKRVGNSDVNAREVRTSIRLPHLHSLLSISYDPFVEAEDLIAMAGAKFVDPMPGVLIALRYPNRPPPDPKVRSIKDQLLEGVGFEPPVEWGVGVQDPLPVASDWEFDIGMEGGGGNSKGDGPDVLTLSEQQSMIVLIQAATYVLHYPESPGVWRFPFFPSREDVGPAVFAMDEYPPNTVLKTHRIRNGMVFISTVPSGDRIMIMASEVAKKTLFFLYI